MDVFELIKTLLDRCDRINRGLAGDGAQEPLALSKKEASAIIYGLTAVVHKDGSMRDSALQDSFQKTLEWLQSEMDAFPKDGSADAAQLADHVKQWFGRICSLLCALAERNGWRLPKPLMSWYMTYLAVSPSKNNVQLRRRCAHVAPLASS